MTGHLSVRHGVRGLLQAQRLEVNANAAVRDDEVGVNGTLCPSRILSVQKESERKRKIKPGGETSDSCAGLLSALRRSHSLIALAWQGVTLQARGQRDVVDEVATAAALQTHLGGLRPHWRGRDDDAVHLHQTGHLLRLRGGEGNVRCDQLGDDSETQKMKKGGGPLGTLRPRMEA